MKILPSALIFTFGTLCIWTIDHYSAYVICCIFTFWLLVCPYYYILVFLNESYYVTCRRIQDIIAQNKGSVLLELQQRSIEFDSILQKHQNIRYGYILEDDNSCHLYLYYFIWWMTFYLKYFAHMSRLQEKVYQAVHRFTVIYGQLVVYYKHIHGVVKNLILLLCSHLFF